MKIPTVDIHTVLVSPRQDCDTRSTDEQVKTSVNTLGTVFRREAPCPLV